MTLYQFKFLSEAAKAETVWERGVLIGERSDAFHHIALFQLDGFYVEIYHHTHFNVITGFKSFSNLKKLQPYLEAISLEGLV